MRPRRILISGSRVYGGLPRSLANAFEAIGWEVLGFDDQKALEESHPWAENRLAYRLLWRRMAGAVQRGFIAAVSDFRPDLVLVTKGFYFDPATISEARRLAPGAVMMHFNPDNSFNDWHFGNSNDWVLKTIPLYDAHATWGEFLIPMLKAAGAREAFHLPFACDFDLHHPVVCTSAEREYFGSDVIFVGSWDQEREQWLSELSNYRLKIWGNGWGKAKEEVRKRWQGKALLGDDFAKACQAAKINLNLIRKQNLPAHNMRTFEILACGGFLVSTRTTEQSRIISEGKDFACFSDPRELRSTIDRYIHAEDERKCIAYCGHDKVRRLHRYSERAARISDISLRIASASNSK